MKKKFLFDLFSFKNNYYEINTFKTNHISFTISNFKLYLKINQMFKKNSIFKIGLI